MDFSPLFSFLKIYEVFSEKAVFEKNLNLFFNLFIQYKKNFIYFGKINFMNNVPKHQKVYRICSSQKVLWERFGII